MHPLIGIFGGALLTLAAMLGLGRIAWRGGAPHWTLELASGAALLSAALFFLLVFQLAHPALVVPLCALGAASLLWRPRPLSRPAAPLWMLAVVAAYGFWYLVHAAAPEIQPDAAGYHLGLVADWARRQGMAPRVGFYELLPLGMETLFYPAFLVGGHSAAKLVHFGIFLATIPLIAWIGKENGISSGAAFAAAGLYFLVPVAAISGSSAYNDAAAAFFPLAAFGALLAEPRGGCGSFFHAGLAAGFAYAVKMSGAAAAAGAAAWGWLRGGRRGAALVVAGVLLCAGPWLARNLALTGNPVAPLGNRIFPNDHFHAYSEAILGRHFASYDGVSRKEIPAALALDGAKLQGLAGPALFLLPLALAGLRKPQGRLLLAAAFLLLLPWTRNIGARFLLPSLPFFFLALASAAGERPMRALFVAQALVCSPWVVAQYSHEQAWRLRGLPWKAALRIEPESEYLRRSLYEFSFVEKAAPRVGADSLLDLYGLPYAYLNTVPLGPLSSAAFDNAATALALAHAARPERIAVMRAEWPTQFVRAVRVRLAADWPDLWSIQDVRFEWRSRRVPVSAAWLLEARPNAGDAWLALDGNPATRWFAWDDSRAGAFWQVSFGRPRPLEAVTVRTVDAGPRPPVALEVQALDGRWRDESARLRKISVERRSWKREAARFLKAMGIRWIAAPVGGTGHGPVGRSLRNFPDAWGVEPVLEEKDIVLVRIRD